jgi:peptidoglycan/LPS O-acetylase OafA/YrhL
VSLRTQPPIVCEGRLSKKHLPELDGLRGIAVLMVMAFHFFLFGGIKTHNRLEAAFVTVIGAGWSGVDLFFVLSGFLITGILFDSRQRPGFFRTFYSRRIFRIFPLYYAFLVLSFFLFPRLDASGTFEPMPLSDQLWMWSYLSNVRIALKGWGAVTPPLRHFWSLAIEEQFYILWPWIVFAASRRRLMCICAFMYLSAAALRIGLCAQGSWLAAYALTPTRMDALAVGAFLALLMREPLGYKAAVRWAKPVLTCSTLALATMFVLRKGLKSHDPVVVALGSSLLALVFGAILVLGLTSPLGSRSRWILASPILRFFGTYSYALYVFHQPVALYLRALAVSAGMVPSRLHAVLATPVVYFVLAPTTSVVAALVSWHFWEKHFLKLKNRFAYLPARPKQMESKTGQETARAHPGWLNT